MKRKILFYIAFIVIIFSMDIGKYKAADIYASDIKYGELVTKWFKNPTYRPDGKTVYQKVDQVFVGYIPKKYKMHYSYGHDIYNYSSSTNVLPGYTFSVANVNVVQKPSLNAQNHYATLAINTQLFAPLGEKANIIESSLRGKNVSDKDFYVFDNAVEVQNKNEATTNIIGYVNKGDPKAGIDLTKIKTPRWYGGSSLIIPLYRNGSKVSDSEIKNLLSTTPSSIEEANSTYESLINDKHARTLYAIDNEGDQWTFVITPTCTSPYGSCGLNRNESINFVIEYLSRKLSTKNGNLIGKDRTLKYLWNLDGGGSSIMVYHCSPKETNTCQNHSAYIKDNDDDNIKDERNVQGIFYWRIQDSTLNYTLNGGTISSSNPSNYSIDKPNFTLNNPSKVGYSFTGWTGNALSTKTKTVTIPKGSTGNRNYEANYEAYSYKVNYTTTEEECGTNSSTQSYYDSTFYKENPKCTGYTFEGWTAAGLNTTTAKIGDTNETTETWEDINTKTKATYFKNLNSSPNGTVILTSNWIANNYTIKFNGNGSTEGNMEDMSLTYGTEEQLTTNAFVRSGYTFAGWNTEADGSGSNYTNNQKVKNLTSTDGKTITLYAKWIINNYSITYNLNGGSVTENPTNFNINSEQYTLNNPVKTGYTFLGWTGSNGTTPQTTVTIDKENLENKNYIANWAVNKYTVKFNGNGNDSGTTEQMTNIPYDETKTLNLNGFIKQGYMFTSWNTKQDGTGNNYSNGATIKSLATNNNDVITLYAQWIEEGYTITYILNGGINNPENRTNYQTGDSIQLKNPTKKGATFIGWYTDKDFTNKIENITSNMTENLTLYAKWVENEYTITYDSKGGSTVEQTTKTYNEIIEEPISPTKEGYIFIGWFTDEELNNKYTFYRMPDENLTLYAGWRKNTCIITFNSNGGNELLPIEIVKGTKLVKPNDPVKEGYDFVGWYLDENLNSQYIFDNKVENDMTLYAKYNKKKYIVNFDTDNGSGISSIEVEHGDSIVLSDTTEKTGYRFAGWYKDNNKTEKYNGEEITSNTTLYALWEKKEYTISFQTNGGNQIESITKLFDEEVEEPIAPIKNDYRFAGWYSDEDFNYVYTFSKMSAQNITLYAKWIENEHIISYEMNGGINNTGNPTSYASGDEIDLLLPEKEGYTFENWYTDQSLTNKIERITGDMNSDLTLYAGWDINKYTIELDTNGGNDISSIEAEYGSVIELPQAEKIGHTFKGWYKDIGLTQVYNDEVVTENITLYAAWQLNKYTINFESDGGSIVNSITDYYNSKIQAPTNPLKEGYRFAGWYSDKELTQLFSFTEMPSMDITLYPKWVNNNENIIYYELNGGVNNVNNPTHYITGEEKNIIAPTKKLAEFKGWYLDKEYTKKITMITKDMTGDITLYALWSDTQEVKVPPTSSNLPLYLFIIKIIVIIVPISTLIIFMKKYNNSIKI